MKDHASFIRAAIMVMSEKADVVVLMIGRDVKNNTEFMFNELPETLSSRFYF